MSSFKTLLEGKTHDKVTRKDLESLESKGKFEFTLAGEGIIIKKTKTGYQAQDSQGETETYKDIEAVIRDWFPRLVIKESRFVYKDPYKGKLPGILKDLRQKTKDLKKACMVLKPEVGVITSILDALDTIEVNLDMTEDTQGPYKKGK